MEFGRAAITAMHDSIEPPHTESYANPLPELKARIISEYENDKSLEIEEQDGFHGLMLSVLKRDAHN